MSYRQLEPLVQNALPSAVRRVEDAAPDVKRFRAAYVLERRILEQMRYGASTPVYHPSKTLSGVARYQSIERKPPEDKWLSTYVKLRQVQPLVPWQYVRVLFSAIRFTDAPVPQLAQLASEANRDLVITHLTNIDVTLQTQTTAEYQRANLKILHLQRGGSGHSFARAVYYALVDTNLGLSPIFRYSMSAASLAAIRIRGGSETAEPRVLENLERIGRAAEYHAALDYAVFPDLFDRIWGSRIPDRLRLVAPGILAEALA